MKRNIIITTYLRRFFLIVQFVAGLFVQSTLADIRMPHIFGNSMVLQRNQPIAIWGWSSPKEKISVFLNKQHAETTADETGNWKLYLKKEKEGGPYELLVKGENEIRFTDVLIGEVWLCSGQSNMAFQVKGALNPEIELDDADYPHIRHVEIPRITSGVLINEGNKVLQWKQSNAENSCDFTAVGFFFARELYKKLGVPIGLIHASWGGTIIETWISREALKKEPECQEIMKDYDKFPLDSLNKARPKHCPCLLFNGMINPLIPYTIKGVLWYQGENNAYWASYYRTLFPVLINDWRRQWKQGDFPFYFVQVASYKANGGTSQTGSTWAELRESQTHALSLHNTGQAIAIDVGKTNDIHPRNKQEVSKRLAALALHHDYEQRNVFSGPVFKRMRVSDDKVIVSFNHVHAGLTTKDGSSIVSGFEVAGSDHYFYPAQAEIIGNKVVIYHNAVKKPIAIRYAWADDALKCNLFNKDGFPAAPFRSDNWTLSSDGRKLEYIHYP